MVIVLIAARYKRLVEWINKRKYEGIDGIYTIKIVGPKVFLYVDTNFDFKTIVSTFKRSIKEQGGLAYIYEFYPIYREKIDYNAYMSAQTKDTMRYFNTKHKDLSNQELELFLKESFA